MAAKSAQLAVPVSPSRVKISGTESPFATDASQRLTIRPVAEIFIGGADVTSANGLRVPAGERVDLVTEDAIYATAGVATTVHALQVGVA